MPLTTEQLTRLRDDIASHPIWGSVAHTGDNAFTIASAYNLPASPDFWVYRTSLAEQEIYEATSSESTTWSWTTYMAQTVTERDAWMLMFRPGQINPSLPQARAGITQIFSGNTQPQIAQRTHLTALFRRRATEAEQLFVTTGAGTTASPATMGHEGPITMSDVTQCWDVP
jgi:hypothetical protein